ncbi:TetR/AcrR family transcriptional regulator [Nocardioides sp. Kera G14]|uniref:TetR/AcrR family transcriptional regulator n=1 Tax=Nocardioides sp. Kera G14 TaxID=2884264 RepID=UPI001D127592|nr:TetR/AcrR family transcriptional regulator [Nocardioides sp. Kera G14]UDY24443.1 TetR/AcrR family transcriptional regulator [Nocardioides sp. Kera G14]
MASSVPGSSRGRGRPVEIDREHLARIALQLFQERGYDDVSAAEIAAAAGVSRRSLFRYFPTKADLVWDRFEESLENLEDALATADGEPIPAASAALLMTAEQTPVLALTRARMQIIANHGELFSYGSSRLQEQSSILRSYLVGRGLAPIDARVVGSALTLAAFHGYIVWATGDSEEHPAVVVRQALGSLSLF